ncbi:MAG TPA: hypothetical protein VKV26_13980 [Dehalococcoidia bacterium]|nr:hypothetical protein [Dehalococcoidia bacterium]
MDSDFQLDIAEVRKHLDETQVVGFFFPFLRRTLLLDTRTNGSDGPLVIVTPMVQSVEERMRSLRKLRPRFPRPDSMTLIPWPKFVDSLERLGVTKMIEDRMATIGGEALRGRCQAAFAELRRTERQQVQFAITGEGYETLWAREPETGNREQ